MERLVNTDIHLSQMRAWASKIKVPVDSVSADMHFPAQDSCSVAVSSTERARELPGVYFMSH